MFKKSKSKHLNFVEVFEKCEHIFSNVTDKIPPVKKYRAKKLFKKRLKYLIVFFLLVLLFFVAMISFSFLKMKNIYDESWQGKQSLEEAVFLILDKSFDEAGFLSGEAENSFKTAYKELDKIKQNFSVRYTPGLLGQIDDLKYLLHTVEILSRSLTQVSLMGKEIDTVLSGKLSESFSDLNLEEKKRLLKYFYEAGPELNGLKANLQLAQISVKNIGAGGLLWPLRKKINELEIKLDESVYAIKKIIPLSELIPVLAGYPKTGEFLVLFQNNDELRPSGGFIGSYGILRTESGDILSFNTHDVYHLDMPVKDKINITPPEPIKKYLIDKWYFRDSNWWPDFPTSAQKALWFFYKEDELLPETHKINEYSGEFAGVIGITPDFISSLLAITGPIKIEEVVYDQNNFKELLQYKVQMDYSERGLSEWERKKEIGVIMTALQNKLFSLPSHEWARLVKTLEENILAKNILLFFTDNHLQSLSLDTGWAGEIKDATGDYLMVVDANLASYKSDAVVKKSIFYNLEKRNDDYYVRLRMNYSHLGTYDWRTTKYRTYTRVYLPPGSELISHNGLEQKIPDIYEEFNKTVIGGFLTVAPGKMANLIYEYKLPRHVADLIKTGKYNLYIQKQAGNKVTQLTVDLNLGLDIKSFQPNGFYVKNNKQSIKWESDLLEDRFFEINSQ